MMRRTHWLAVAASVGLLCWPAAAQYEVAIDFESPTYTVGDLDGQDGWTATIVDGGNALVLDSDNGPSGGGSQCLELNVLDAWTEPNYPFEVHCTIKVEKAFADVVANGGPLVTFKYDMKITEDNTFNAYFRIPGSGTAHWWTFWCQRKGVDEPLDPNAYYFDSGPKLDAPDEYDGQWHTITWTFVYGDTGDGQTGQLLSVQLDDQFVIKHSNYHPWQATPYVVDNIYLLFRDGSWPAYTFDDRCMFDNLLIRGEPLPSAVPVANAPDVTQDPGSWDGVVLDGSGSTDDGEIVRYRWTIGYGWDASLLYDGPEAAPLVDLGPGTHELVLTVFDDDGLRDTDTATYTIGARPPIVDEVAGPWGIRNADIFGTGASDQIRVDTRSGEFEVLNTAYVNDAWVGLPGEDNGNIVFDRFGNLYWLCWNEYLESYTPQLQRRWRGHDQGAEKKVGNWSIDNGSLIAGIRYIYVVGGGRDAHGGVPAVYAFEKSTGQLVWETGLTGENWAYHGSKPKVTLYNDRLYVVGQNVLEWVKIHQVDATTGNHDWASNCYVEMQYNELNNPGSVAFVPDAYGAGLHGLFFNQMSTPGVPWTDGFADMVAIQIDPASGATVVWGPGEGIDGPGLHKSHPIYSQTTGLVYTPSFKNVDGVNWPHSMYAWQPSATPSPLVATHTPVEDDVHHGWRDNFALDFDGVTVHAPGEGDRLRSYTDNGDGTFDVVYRTFGGFWVTGWGFEQQGCLVKDQKGDSIYVTVTRSEDRPEWLVPSKLYAINLSEPVDPNDPNCTPIAEWVCHEWDGDVEWWDYGTAYYGPTPGPDGSFYIFQADSTYWYGHRITRLRFLPPACPGDVDADGDTDLSDLAALLAAYGTQQGDPNYVAGADFDNDGDVDLSDLAHLLADYGCVP